MWCRGCFAVVLVVMAVGLATGAIAARNLGRFLDVTTEARPVDAIVVMGGEGGRYVRTQHAVELHNSGFAPVVVFSGGTLLDAGLACSSTELSLDAAEKLGLPAKAIVLSGEAQSTYDEAENIAVLAKQEEWESLILVTDRFHTRRSLQTMRWAMPEHTIYASAPLDSRFDADKWWGNEHGLVFAINELLKLVFYWREYGVHPVG